ncbi:MAG: outer membrane lipoprotein-sorting protein [Candidatus Omnitrophota bacterium]
MKKVIYSIIVLILFFLVFPIFAADVNEIVSKANNVAYYNGSDGAALVNMTIVDSQGRARNKTFKILRFDIADGGEQKFYVYFKEPADVNGMVYMVWKHMDKDDDRWLYLPALDLVRRIAASDKRSSFVGSNFVYEDISGRSLDSDKHELLSEGDGFYQVRNMPKDMSAVEFAYFDVYIDKNNFMPVKAAYYNSEGKLIRKVEALEIKDIAGYPTVTKSKAIDMENNAYTITEFSEIEYDLGLDESIFTERYLRRPPIKWLK